MLTLPSAALLAVFIPTFFFVSITPGMCMTLAMTLGMTLGLKRTLWMMWGELLGVALVATLSVVGVATLMLQYPVAFDIFKYLGGGYLGYLGIQLWQNKGHMAVRAEQDNAAPKQRLQLAMQGFITAAANPKGWAFFIALLPPFIDQSRPLVGQFSILILLILLLEFICMLIYAGSGKTLARYLNQGHHLQTLNRIAGTLMIGVGLWLALG